MKFYTDDKSHTRCSCCNKRCNINIAEDGNPKKRGRRLGYSKYKYVVTFNDKYEGICENLNQLRDRINFLKDETLTKQQVYRLTTGLYTKTKRYSGLNIETF